MSFKEYITEVKKPIVLSEESKKLINNNIKLFQDVISNLESSSKEIKTSGSILISQRDTIKTSKGSMLSLIKELKNHIKYLKVSIK